MNATDRQNKALLEIGDTGRNALYEVALPISVTGGTWRLSFAGRLTAPMAAFAPREVVKAALELLPNIAADNVAVVGVAGGPYRLEMQGVLGAQALPMSSFPLGADGSQLVAPASLVVRQIEMGAPPVLQSLASARDADYANIAHERLRFLYLKRDLLDALLGESQKNVDADLRGDSEKLSQQHDNLLKLRRLVQAEIEQIATSGAGANVPLSATYLTKIRKTTPNGQPYGVMGIRDDGRLR